MAREAQILDKFPSHQGRPPLYPWDEWSDGQIRELVHGVHFNCALKSLRALIHRTAASRGLKANTKITKEGNMIISFYKPRGAK